MRHPIALMFMAFLAGSISAEEGFDPVLSLSFDGPRDWDGLVLPVVPAPEIIAGSLHVDYGSRLQFSSRDRFDFAGDFTLCLWVAFSSSDSFGNKDFHPLISRGNWDSDLEFEFAINGGVPVFLYSEPRKPGLRTGFSTIGRSHGATIRYANLDWIKCDPAIVEDRWHFLVAQRDGSTLRVYIDGELSLERRAAPPAVRLPMEDVKIGRDTIGENRESNREVAHCLMNKLRFFRSALPLVEIKRLFVRDATSFQSFDVKIKTTRNYFPSDILDYNYDLENTLNIVSKFRESAPGVHSNRQIAEVKVCREAIVLDGARVFPFACYPNLGYLGAQSVVQSVRHVEDFAAAGVNVAMAFLSKPSVYWKGESNYDFTMVDNAVRSMIGVDDDLRIVVGIYMSIPDWFRKRFPDDVELYSYGDGDDSSFRRWNDCAPFSSPAWRAVSSRAIADLVAHVESRDYSGRVIGYHVVGGDAAEWYWPATWSGGMPGYSDVTRVDFVNWMKRKYCTIENVRRSWGDAIVDFEQIKVPTVSRRRATERGFFRDRKLSADVFDFREYMNETTVSIVRSSVESAKRACERRKIVSTYYGYSLLFSGRSDVLQKGGMERTREVISLNDIDMIATPVDYAERRSGEPGANIFAFDGSARMRGKIVWREEDLRTHFWPRLEYGRTNNLGETLGVMTRDFGHALTRPGTGLWFMAMAGNAAWHQNEMMERVQLLSRIARESMGDNRQHAKSAAEVAFVFDEKSLAHLSVASNAFINDHCWGAYKEASMMGAPFEVYFLDDIDSIPDKKLYIFLNCYELSDDQVRMIVKKTRRNNSVSVWCYAAGYISRNGFDVGRMSSVTGFKFEEDLSGIRGSIKGATDHLIAESMRSKSEYAISPAFYPIEDGGSLTIGCVGDRPAMSLREHRGTDSWRSVYSLFPLDRWLLNGLCRYAGVHVYQNSFDVFGASDSYIMIHATRAGRKTISLPGRRPVRNVITGDLLGVVSSVEMEMSRGETNIFCIR